MARAIQITPQAQHDLHEQARHIAKDSLPAALKLLDAADAAYQFLADNPFVGVATDFDRIEIHHLRVWRIKRFPQHQIFYRVTRDFIMIVRVLHTTQDRGRIFGNKPPAPEIRGRQAGDD